MKKEIGTYGEVPCCDDYQNSKKVVQFGLRGEILPLRSDRTHSNGAREARKAQQF